MTKGTRPTPSQRIMATISELRAELAAQRAQTDQLSARLARLEGTTTRQPHPLDSGLVMHQQSQISMSRGDDLEEKIRNDPRVQAALRHPLLSEYARVRAEVAAELAGRQPPRRRQPQVEAPVQRQLTSNPSVPDLGSDPMPPPATAYPVADRHTFATEDGKPYFDMPPMSPRNPAFHYERDPENPVFTHYPQQEEATP
jgi:hypothetical protein